MSALKWDESGKKYYETGTDRGVLYVSDGQGGYEEGVAWNGLTGVTESPGGAEVTDLWADNIKYASIRSAETFGGTIEAYTYPKEFEECDGSAEVATGVTIGQQDRKAFGFSYRTMINSDTSSGTDYKLHIVYGATCSPSEKAYSTINDSPEAITFSWEFDTTPVPVTGRKPTSHIIIDSRTATKAKLQELEKKLYGDESEGNPTLPKIEEVISTMTAV